MEQLEVLWSPPLLTLVGLYIVLGLSLYIVFATGQFSLGTAAFMAIGAYSSGVLTVKLHVPLPLAVVIAAMLAGILGLVVGYPALRIRGIYLAMATIGVGEIVRVFLDNIEYVGGVAGMKGMVGTTVEIVWAVALLSSVFVWLLMRSRYGIAFAAVRLDEDAAQQMGINVTRMKLLAFVISSAMTGLGGALYSHFMFFITPDVFDWRRTAFVLMSVVFGGVGTMWGAIVGSVILTVLPQVITLLDKWQLVFYGILVMVTMVVMPQGLISPQLVRRLNRLWRRPAPISVEKEETRNAAYTVR